MKICPKCQKSTRFIHVIKKDKKTKKEWDIFQCGKCKYNAELTEFTGSSSVNEELKKPGVPIWNGNNFI